MTDNDYRIEDGFEKVRPNYTLRRVKFALAVVGLVVSVTLMLTWHGGSLAGAFVVESVYLATALWLVGRFVSEVASPVLEVMPGDAFHQGAAAQLTHMVKTRDGGETIRIIKTLAVKGRF